MFSSAISVVLGIPDRSSMMVNLDPVWLLSDTLRIFTELIERPYGTTLITGPTGSGKTFTLYCVPAKIKSLDKNEDPIVYELFAGDQILVRPSIESAFASGLRSIGQPDLDVIMAGQIRGFSEIQRCPTNSLAFTLTPLNQPRDRLVGDSPHGGGDNHRRE
jgi:type IV pilus assembly protein PilB